MKEMRNLKEKKNMSKINARTAGVLYLIVIVSGLFSEMFVRSGIIIPGDASQTFQNIKENEFLFRIGFASDLIMVMSDVGLALLFYLLLKPVNQGLSLLAAFFRLGQATILGINLLNYFMPILIIENPDFASNFSMEQMSSFSSLFLTAHSYGYMISGVFFAFSCIILGYLMSKSEYFPNWLGILVLAAGISYLLDSFTNFLFPDFVAVSEILVLVVAVISELTLCFYLLFVGVRKTKREE